MCACVRVCTYSFYLCTSALAPVGCGKKSASGMKLMSPFSSHHAGDPQGQSSVTLGSWSVPHLSMILAGIHVLALNVPHKHIPIQ